MRMIWKIKLLQILKTVADLHDFQDLEDRQDPSCIAWRSPGNNNKNPHEIEDPQDLQNAIKCRMEPRMRSLVATQNTVMVLEAVPHCKTQL